MIAKWVLIHLFSLLLAVACGSATKPEYSELPDDDSESGLVSIAYLKSRCNGLSTTIKSDISIKGAVVANDLYGEFYKTIVLIDESGGVEVAIDKERLCMDFPLYTKVSITCNGLAVGRVGGKVILGAQPTGQYTVDRIAERSISTYLLCHRAEVNPLSPCEVKIEEIGIEHISGYVRLADVRFVDEEIGMPWCDSVDGQSLDTDRHIVDASGRTMTIRISSRCEYAGESVPSGSGTLCGIVDYSGDSYFLRITNHEIYF